MSGIVWRQVNYERCSYCLCKRGHCVYKQYLNGMIPLIMKRIHVSPVYSSNIAAANTPVRTNERVVVGSGLSEEFLVNIGLRQGSAFSPLLFIMVMEIISRKISTKDILRKMMYVDDLAIIAESKQDLQEVLEEWKGVFEKHGLRMSLEKTEVMWVGHQR